MSCYLYLAIFRLPKSKSRMGKKLFTLGSPFGRERLVPKVENLLWAGSEPLSEIHVVIIHSVNVFGWLDYARCCAWFWRDSDASKGLLAFNRFTV